jgi:hypothetical protein
MFKKIKDFVKYRIVFDSILMISMFLCSTIGTAIPLYIVKLLIKVFTILLLKPIQIIMWALEQFRNELIQNSKSEEHFTVLKQARMNDWINSL